MTLEVLVRGEALLSCCACLYCLAGVDRVFFRRVCAAFPYAFL